MTTRSAIRSRRARIVAITYTQIAYTAHVFPCKVPFRLAVQETVFVTIAIDVRSPTSIRVNFSAPLLDHPGLAVPALYAIDPPVEVLAAIPETSETPSYVDLTIGEQQDGVTHTLTAHAVRSAADTPLFATFPGTGFAPTIVLAGANGSTRIRVRFSELMSPSSGLLVAASYTLTALGASTPRSVSSVSAMGVDEPSTVELLLSGPLSPGANGYSLDVAGTLADVAGNPLGSPPSQPITGPAPGANVDHVALALDRLLEQWRGKPKIEGLLSAWVRPFNDLEQALQDMLAYRSIATGFGAQLDGIGDNVAMLRNGASDELYRRRLLANGMAARASSTGEEILAILRVLDAGFAPSAISLIPAYAAAFGATGLVAEGELAEGHWVGRFLHRITGAGIRSIYFFEESGPGVELLILEEETDPGTGGTLEEETAPGLGELFGEAV